MSQIHYFLAFLNQVLPSHIYMNHTNKEKRRFHIFQGRGVSVKYIWVCEVVAGSVVSLPFPCDDWLHVG